MPRRIAIVEDEPAIRDNYVAAFEKHGYRVDAFGDRREALVAFERALPDLVVIDVNLGDEPEGGFDLCRALRARSESLPIIFLTARESELDAISGLRLGADDYLTKRLSLAHLLARVSALFRRVDALSEAPQADELLIRGALTLDAERLTVRWGDTRVPLTLTEFWMVHALAKHPGHVKNRQQLMDAANVVLDDATITSQVRRIRKKFLDVDPEFGAIETVYGMGYRWNDGEDA